jgi:hypothetical protein
MISCSGLCCGGIQCAAITKERYLMILLLRFTVYTKFEEYSKIQVQDANLISFVESSENLG